MIDCRACEYLTETPVVLLTDSEVPFALQIHVTEKCNLRCKHCYSESWKRELSIEQFSEIVAQFERLLRVANTEGTIYLTGGEPLLWRPLLKAIQVALKSKILPRLFTNGTLITAAVAKTLKESGIRFVQVSLDGALDVHDSIRGQGTFQRATEGIRHLVANGIEVTVMVTLMKRNLNDIVPLLDIVESLGVKRVAFGRFLSIGNGARIDDDNLSPREVEKAFRLLDEESDRRNVEIIKRDPLWSILRMSSRAFDGCAAGQLLLDVLVDGTVYPCRRLPIPVGNLFEEPLLEIWLASPLLRRLRNRLNYHCEGCQYIQKCGGCRGAAYMATKDPFARDPHCFYDLEGVQDGEADSERVGLSQKYLSDVYR